jgi:hypothetical protein
METIRMLCGRRLARRLHQTILRKVEEVTMRTILKMFVLATLATACVWAGPRDSYRYDRYRGAPRYEKVKKHKGPHARWENPGRGRGRALGHVRYYGPPAPRRYYVRSRRPSPRYIWVDPYLDWRGTRYGYVWVPGAWVLPPRRGAVWIDGFWSPRGGAEIWVSAHWR